MKQKLYLSFLIGLICLLNSQQSYGQAGNNDPTFNVADNGISLNGTIYGLATQSDGKILVLGNIRDRLVRLNPNGSWDNTFNIGTGFEGGSDLYVVKVLSDGKILVGGIFSSYNGTSINGLVRLNANGTLDNTFNIGTGFNGGPVTSIVIQPDGKMVVGGYFTAYNGSSVSRIARLNANGTLDNTFATTGTGLNDGIQLESILVQSDGKIVVAGTFTSYNGTSVNRIARLNADGTLDNTFNIGTGFNQYSACLALQSDGKILVGGEFTSYNGTSSNRIVRLNPDGTFDNTFSIGVGFSNYVGAITLQSDGKILVGGSFMSYNGTSANRIARLNTDGSLDNTLSVGVGFDVSVFNIKVQSDGKILAGGIFTSFNNNPASILVRLNTNGSWDSSLNTASGVSQTVSQVKVQSDGKILVSGGFRLFGNQARKFIMRLNVDGTLDNTFNTVGTGLDNSFYRFLIQSDGKIIGVGGFTSYNGSSVNRIARLNSDGTLDNTFNVGTGFNQFVRDIALQSDGKIVVIGNFTEYNGTAVNYIARLNANGTLDNTFNIGTGFDNQVDAVTIQSDGKILAGGPFTSYNGTARELIVRLNANGTLDNTFNIGTGFNNSPTTFAFQKDGKIVVGGYFTTYNGSSVNRIARLNTNGTLDNTFNIGTGFNNGVRAIAIQSDGKILVGGEYFTTYNGVNISQGITCLNTDGTRDVSFNANALGVTGGIETIALQSDGKIIAGGYFYTYNGVARNNLVRILPSCPNANSIVFSDLPVAPLLQPYNQTLTQNILGGTLSWAVTAGTLPAGLSLNASMGVISGTPTTPTVSNFTIRVSNGVCSATKEYNLIIDPIAGIESRNHIIEKVYPNPSQDKIQIDLKQSGNHSFKLLNSVGKVVKEGKIESSVITLDIASLPQGVYFLELSRESSHQVIRISKI
ncbi:MAG: putative Ig domain-containing protein [Raineya sp.]|jgi:uncharacterized delta-60 repeat protein|nr:putative Ig domain-containing protein [Raineya sp.]